MREWVFVRACQREIGKRGKTRMFFKYRITTSFRNGISIFRNSIFREGNPFDLFAALFLPDFSVCNFPLVSLCDSTRVSDRE